MKIQQIQRRGKQLGLSIIELLIVLAVVAGIIAALLARQSSLEEGEQATRASENVISLANAVRNLGAGKADYTGITIGTISDMGLLPAASLKSDKATTPKYFDVAGNQYELVGGTTSFAIKLTTTSVAICNRAASKLANFADVINSTTVTTASGLVSATDAYKASAASAELNTAKLASGCTANNAIAFQFK